MIALLRLPTLLTLLSLLTTEEARVGAARELLVTLAAVEEEVGDRATIDVLATLARTLAASVSALTGQVAQTLRQWFPSRTRSGR